MSKIKDLVIYNQDVAAEIEEMTRTADTSPIIFERLAFAVIWIVTSKKLLLFFTGLYTILGFVTAGVGWIPAAACGLTLAFRKPIRQGLADIIFSVSEPRRP